MLGALKEIWQYREMLKNLVSKDLRTRYKGSFLGFLWTFLNPLLMLVIYTLIFSTVMRLNIENYAMFLFVGLLPWLFFQGSLLNSANAIVHNGNLIKKIYFPREILPLATVISAMVNYILALTILLPALYFFNISITLAFVAFPVILLINFAMNLGFAFLISALNVYMRDLEHMLGIFTMAWFYLTPIIYEESMVPGQYKLLFSLNPLTPLIVAYRKVMFYGELPQWRELFVAAIIACALLVIGFFVFQVLKKRFAEEV